MITCIFLPSPVVEILFYCWVYILIHLFLRKPAAIIFTCHIYDYHGAVQNKGALDTQHMKFVKIFQLTSKVQKRFSIFELQVASRSFCHSARMSSVYFPFCGPILGSAVTAVRPQHHPPEGKCRVHWPCCWNVEYRCQRRGHTGQHLVPPRAAGYGML